MSSPTNNSLRPAWNRGGNSKGFQPPPAVASERSQSTGTSQQPQQRDNQNYNKFAALDLDDDDEAAVALAINEEAGGGHRPRAVKGRSASVGTTASAASSTTSGRSLADLAARTPAAASGEPRRFSALRSSEEAVSSSTTIKQEAKVIRFTRERLLSMRPAQSLPSPPAKLVQELEGSVILSLEPQDPVCWDTFDAEEIWATVPPRRGSIITNKEQVQGEGGLASSSTVLSTSTRRLSSTSTALGGGLRRESSSSLGRWQRGVALPPPDASATTKPGGTTRRIGASNSRDTNADNPNDLWDDPVVPAEGGSGAAIDFSAFGALPMDDNEPFDFEKMAEASRKLEEEMHGHRSRASSTATAPQDETAIPVHAVTIDASRPLASAGTTIRSGSGDMVNVFEDFDDEPAETTGGATAAGETGTAPPPVKEAGEPVAIQNADADPNASSRLMAMIGVQKDDSVASDPKLSAWGSSSSNPMAVAPAVVKENTTLAGIPLNPWGDPILGGGGSNGAQPGVGLNLQAQFREAELKQKAEADARRREQEELLRRRQEQQQQVEQEQERQRQQQQAGVQSQVEMVLMERISTILESSWGRSDLVSILSTLHAEDSRVIPLLSNVDALRALLLRNPRRVALRQDPALRAEMAALLITNTQWQQQQQQQQQQALQQQQQEEELQRREQQRRMEAEQAAVVAAARQRLVPEAPWFYSDPSKNIQGPFRGEEMRQWFEAGYFKGDLPISQSPNGPFRPLAVIFNDLSAAFVFPGGLEEDQRRQEAEDRERQRQQEMERREIQERQEQERLAREQQLREQQAREQQHAHEQQLLREQQMREQHAREQEERANAEAAAAAQAQNQANGANNESSNQLKMMLGLGEQSSTPEKVAPPQVKVEEKKAAKKKPQQPAVELNVSVAAAPSEPAKSAAPAWGGAAVSKPVARKSMSEIQMEEARAAAVAAMNRQGSRSSGSGWANIAASRGGSTGWSGGSAALKPTATALASTPVAVQPQQRAVSMQPNSSITSGNAQLGTSQVGKVQRSSSTSAADSADAFGAKMSPDLERWCKDQMSRLNGTDDLTLVGFCMTLNDAEEIRQYLTAYLGSTPQVNAFATEFINRKGNPQGKQDEWESTVPVKKGRKKKAGAR